MATSVASGASTSTFDCSDSPKHMIAMPQNTLSTPSVETSPLNGNSNARHSTSNAVAVSRKRCGYCRLNRAEQQRPENPRPTEQQQDQGHHFAAHAGHGFDERLDIAIGRETEL